MSFEKSIGLGLLATVVMCFSSGGRTQAELRAQSIAVKRVVALTTYPRLAQLSAVEGTVQLVAKIRGDGTVESVRRAAGPGILSGEAERVLLKWQFNPCDSGSAVREVAITFNFILDGICTLPDCKVEFEVDLPGTVTVKSQKARAIID
jgi:hypothetical protein